MDENEFKQVVEQYHDAVFKTAFTYLKSAQDAEDVFQEVFLKYYQTEQIFTDDNHRKAWLLRVTINMCKNHLKATANRFVSIDDIPLTTEMNQDEGWVLEQVMKLPPKHSVVLHLFYYEGYSVREIAAITETTEVNVKARLSRGRKQLKAAIESNDLG